MTHPDDLQTPPGPLVAACEAAPLPSVVYRRCPCCGTLLTAHLNGPAVELLRGVADEPARRAAAADLVGRPIHALLADLATPRAGAAALLANADEVLADQLLRIAAFQQNAVPARPSRPLRLREPRCGAATWRIRPADTDSLPAWVRVEFHPER